MRPLMDNDPKTPRTLITWPVQSRHRAELADRGTSCSPHNPRPSMTTTSKQYFIRINKRKKHIFRLPEVRPSICRYASCCQRSYRRPEKEAEKRCCPKVTWQPHPWPSIINYIKNIAKSKLCSLPGLGSWGLVSSCLWRWPGRARGCESSRRRPGDPVSTAQPGPWNTCPIKRCKSNHNMSHT